MLKRSLLDLGFKGFELEDKRYSLMLLDMRMKKYHEENMMVTSFDPKDIYYEDGRLDFEKVSPISPILVDNKEQAKIYNIVNLSLFALSSYLPNDITKLNTEFLSENYDDLIKGAANMDDMDKEYYRGVFVGLREMGRLPEPNYYYDYVVAKEKQSNATERSTALVRATQAGRLMSEKEEAAFGDTFFFVTVLTSMLIGVISLLIFFIK